MFNDRDNLIGVLFLVGIGALAAILLRAIATGERLRLDLDPAVSTVLAVLFFGLILFGMGRAGMFSRFFGRRGGRQWPDPQTGSKSLWDRIRGR